MAVKIVYRTALNRHAPRPAAVQLWSLSPSREASFQWATKEEHPNELPVRNVTVGDFEILKMR